MGIQSTSEISREHAIERITEIAALIADQNYLGLESVTGENDEDLQKFVDNEPPLDIRNIQKWTNRMIEDVMDRPFYRQSIFDNYRVLGGNE